MAGVTAIDIRAKAVYVPGADPDPDRQAVRPFLIVPVRP